MAIKAYRGHCSSNSRRTDQVSSEQQILAPWVWFVKYAMNERVMELAPRFQKAAKAR